MYLNASSGPTFLENGQCKIAKDDSSYYTRDPFNPGGGGAIYDREVVLKLNVAFKSIFGGDKAVYTAARNVSQSQNTNWRPRGAWKEYPSNRLYLRMHLAGPSPMPMTSSFNFRMGAVCREAAGEHPLGQSWSVRRESLPSELFQFPSSACGLNRAARIARAAAHSPGNHAVSLS